MLRDQRKQINQTLSECEMDFVRRNVGKLSFKQMGVKLGCSGGKVYENARISGIAFPNRYGIKETKLEKKGFFDVKASENWIV